MAGIVVLSSCAGTKSALYARGDDAAVIETLAWIMFGGGAVVMALVIGFMAYAIFRKSERKSKIRPARFMFGWGIAFPVVVLGVLLVYSARIGAVLSDEVPPDRLVIEVTGHQWWWEIRYVGATPSRDLVTANELHLPVGRPVQLVLKSSDVIHSFWIPNLAGKQDMIPGRTTELTVTALEPGYAEGHCAEYCGAQHSRMRLQVVMQSPADFEVWLENQRKPAQPPVEPMLVAGQQAFLSSGCPFCHTIRGAGANGKVAPDLTHIGSRRAIAAGTMANTQGNREAWIARAQHFKEEARMPSFNQFEGTELRALAYYLGSLQ